MGPARHSGIVAREKAATDPVLPLRLFRDRTFTASTLVAALIGLVLFGGVLFLPLYLQLARGLTPTLSGLAMMMVALLAASTLSGRAMSRTGRCRTIERDVKRCHTRTWNGTSPASR